MLRSRSQADLAELVHVRATGKLARDPFDYPLISLVALLVERKTVQSHAMRETFGDVRDEPHWTEGAPDIGSTGDPLIDKWERELAAGIEPDLDERG